MVGGDEMLKFIRLRKRMKYKNAILLVGLPGIGLVGQAACRYIIHKKKAKKIAELYSSHFPHHVIMKENGLLRPLRNSFYHFKDKNRDYIVLIGDVQAVDERGQYTICEAILDFCEEIGVNKVISIGGYSTGVLKEKRIVFGLVNDLKLKKELKDLGVVFGIAKGTIVGAAGLLPTFAKFRDMDGICLLGETHGSYVDARSALNVLRILVKYLNIELDLKELEEEANAGEEIIKRIEDEIKKNVIMPPKDGEKDELSYIR
jgi:uncharacterized protein (TIGR00162 family)